MEGWGAEVTGLWLHNNSVQSPTQQVESRLAGSSKTEDFFFPFCFLSHLGLQRINTATTSGKHWNSVSFQRRSFLIFQFFFFLMSLPSI